MINTTAITDLYNTLTSAITAKLDLLYTGGKIDAETYAKIMAQSYDEALKLSVSAVQQQEQIVKDHEIKDAQIEKIQAEIINLEREGQNIPKQGLVLDAQAAQTNQQVANLVAEKLHIDAKKDQVIQQTTNAVIEGTVLQAQKCKLDAEFDVLLQSKLKTAAEVTLLAQKTQTEKAQTVAMGVDADSVIGRQKNLYAAQATGFTRDAEQKAAKLMIDSWNVRRTTDEGTVADGTNMLYDPAVGRAVNKLLQGVGA